MENNNQNKNTRQDLTNAQQNQNNSDLNDNDTPFPKQGRQLNPQSGSKTQNNNAKN